MNRNGGGKEPTRTVCMELPEELHRGLKVKCAMQGKTQAGVLAALVRRWLAGAIEVDQEPAPR